MWSIQVLVCFALDRSVPVLEKKCTEVIKQEKSHSAELKNFKPQNIIENRHIHNFLHKEYDVRRRKNVCDPSFGLLRITLRWKNEYRGD